jgi:hypothetical protein
MYDENYRKYLKDMQVLDENEDCDPFEHDGEDQLEIEENTYSKAHANQKKKQNRN